MKNKIIIILIYYNLNTREIINKYKLNKILNHQITRIINIETDKKGITIIYIYIYTTLFQIVLIIHP